MLERYLHAVCLIARMDRCTLFTIREALGGNRGLGMQLVAVTFKITLLMGSP